MARKLAPQTLTATTPAVIGGPAASTPGGPFAGSQDIAPSDQTLLVFINNINGTSVTGVKVKGSPDLGTTFCDMIGGVVGTNTQINNSGSGNALTNGATSLWAFPLPPWNYAEVTAAATTGTTLVTLVSTAIPYTNFVSSLLSASTALPTKSQGTLTTVGAGTILAATIVSTDLLRTGSTSAFTDTSDTAANIIAAITSPYIGYAFEWTYENATSALATLAGGTGVTLAATVPAGFWATFLVTYSAVSTITFTLIKSGPINALPYAKFTTINVTTGTLAAGNASGAAFTSLTSTNATPGSQAMRTPAQILTDTPGIQIGMSYVLFITNTGAGTFTLATDSGSGFTMTGTMTVAQNTTRMFIVTLNTATTGTVQSVGVGTYS